MEQILFVPDEWTISCLVDATSPSPTVVENVVVHSFHFMSFTELRVTASWEQPVEVNGPLEELVYSKCISREPVTGECTGSDDSLITKLANVTVSPTVRTWVTHWSI